MEKHEDNLDKLLKAELEKEAGEIMEEVDSDESLQDISFPEDLDEKMWSKIQEYEEQQKAYEKLSDADKEAIRLGREVQALRGGENTKDHLKKDVESDSYIDNVVSIEHVKHETNNKASDDGTNGETEKEAGKKKVKKRKRHWKAYGIVAIVAVLAMMWSMVSIGGTPFFGKLWTQTIGDRKMTQVDTEREDGDKNEVDDYDEFQVYDEIKEKIEQIKGWVQTSGGAFAQLFHKVIPNRNSGTDRVHTPRCGVRDVAGGRIRGIKKSFPRFLRLSAPDPWINLWIISGELL